jgi:uncharacterized protein (DUF1778 family)
MGNSKEREEKYEEPDLDYFKAWDNPSLFKSERLYIRISPENKKRVRLACNRVELSLSDFVTGATLEATDLVIDKYL